MEKSPNPRRSSIPPVAATANDGDLPLDLLYEILLRLPTVSICRFRAVCRSWWSLLCHPEFIAAAHNSGLFLAIGVKDFSSRNEIQLLDMKSGDAVKHVKIYGDDAFPPPYSRNEACALSGDRVLCVIDKSGRLRLLDSASGAFFVLPDPPLCYSASSCIVGRAVETGDIKVLVIPPSYTRREQHVCKIITLGDVGWRDTGSPPLKVVMGYTGDFVVVNGVVYFLSKYNEYEELQQVYKIMPFDLNSEAWRPVETSLLGPTKQFCLAELNGHLVACHSNGDLSTEIELWFLMDLERPHWSKRYIITMPCHQNIVPATRYYEYVEQPLAMLDDGRIVLWIRVSGLEDDAETDMLWIYDPRTNTFTEGTRVPYCSRVSVFTWNLLHSRPTGAIDMAAKRLLISRRHHQSGVTSSTHKGLELICASTEEDTYLFKLKKALVKFSTQKSM